MPAFSVTDISPSMNQDTLDDWEKAVIDLFINAAISFDCQNLMVRFMDFFLSR